VNRKGKDRESQESFYTEVKSNEMDAEIDDEDEGINRYVDLMYNIN
jgi:hypothetical protein